MGSHCITWNTIYLITLCLCASAADQTKFNVSQSEYTRMMTIYLERLEATNPTSPDLLKLLTSEYTEKSQIKRNGAPSRLHFAINGSLNSKVESATLRMLSPPMPGREDAFVQVQIYQIYQILGARRRRLIDDRWVLLSKDAPKWIEFDVSRGVQSWMRGDRNLGLEVKCPDCSKWNASVIVPHLSLPTISTLVYVHTKNQRVRRSGDEIIYSKNRRTECNARNPEKPRCCRHKMQISFRDIKGMENVIQPKTFDAGYCQGRCPLNYNLANNYAKIKSLMRKKNHTIPRLCCAPSTLDTLEILTVDNANPTKLKLQKWKNMKVMECACS